MDKLNQTDESATIGKWQISRFLSANDFVLLALAFSSESELQHALNGFAAACDFVGLKISNFIF